MCWSYVCRCYKEDSDSANWRVPDGSQPKGAVFITSLDSMCSRASLETQRAAARPLFFGKVLEAKLLCSGNPATLSHGSLNLGHSQSARRPRPFQLPSLGTVWLLSRP